MALLRCFLLINVNENIFVSSNEHLASHISAVSGICSSFEGLLVNIKLFRNKDRKTQLSM